ncbi:MAG: hypothetical protein KJ621_09320 [Proteobacteria bacterium]|nr:hypothetical protein [Pseudomonadota bacterium]
MSLNDWLPEFDFREYHERVVRAAPEKIYRAIPGLDMRRSWLTISLLRLRELPWRLARRDFKGPGFGHTLDDLLALGFVILQDEQPRELVFGLVGRFWGLNPSIDQIAPAEFVSFYRPGHAKVAANFLVRPQGADRCLVSTETRIKGLDAAARRRFRPYWSLIRPFSGLIRREWLRVIKQDAETNFGS